MRNLISIFTFFSFAFSDYAIGQMQPGISVPGAAFAQLTSNAPDVALWHWKVFQLFPANCSDFNKAVSEEKSKLKPGESKRFAVYFSILPDGQPIRFMYLRPTDQDALHSANIQRMAEIELTREKYGITRLPMISESEFKRETNLQKFHQDYSDYAFSMNAMNAINGFSERDAVNMNVYGIDEKARAVANGTVILVASKDSDAYQVYNLERKELDPQSYIKKETLKEMGNTVWLYIKSNGGAEYTVVYSHLDKINVKLGQSLTQTQEIGAWKSAETTDCRWYIFRIFGMKQVFLRESSGDQKPYCVYPIHPNKTK